MNQGNLTKFGGVYRIKSTATVESDGKVNESNESNWELVGNRHFNIEPGASKEFLVGNQLNAQLTHTLTTSYDTQSKAFTTKDKFVYQGRTFSFSGPGVNLKEQNRFMSFPAIEVK